MTTPLAEHWTLDPEVTFLNHGSFGACPRVVLAHQSELRARMEREPVLFLARETLDRIDAARAELAEFVGADPAGLAFVTNATSGVNTVLRSLRFEPGDQILVTNQGYPACNNTAEFVAGLAERVEVVFADVPFPIDDPQQVVDAVLGAATDRTKLAIVDHITSPTGIILPIEAIVRGLESRGIDTLVDGAHAPGMVPLELDRLAAAYYTGNCHKWMCAPKGAALLHVRADRRDRIRPLVISHGAKAPRGERSFFHMEADWTGTHDPTAWLSVPAAIRFGREVVPGGWPEIRERNRDLALHARALLTESLGVESPAPDSMIGSLVSLRLPSGEEDAPTGPLPFDPLHLQLFDAHRIEVPIMPWPAKGDRLLRISAQLYNSIEQYERLAVALREMW